VPQRDAEAPRVRLLAILVVREVVVRLQVRELAEVIETPHGPAGRGGFVMCAEVASVDPELASRNPRLAAPRNHAHHTRQRVAAEHDAVGIAQHFDAIDAGE